MPIRSTGRLFRRSSWPEARYIIGELRTETVGGALLLGAALIAIVWANSPWHESYAAVRDFKIAVPGTGVKMSIGHWAADGLLAIFFLVAGIELKREFRAGELSDRAKAIVPVTAALAGVALPAIVYAVSVTALGGSGDSLSGWAIPTATDIAFALAVLAVIGTHLPPALRAFLLTLAVVDDLVAITIIAIFYSTDIQAWPLLLSLVPIGLFSWVLRRHITNPFLLVALALVAWYLVYKSGIHATVAGVLLGLSVPTDRDREFDAQHFTLAEHLEHKIRPLSAGVAVPVFAFCAAGVRVVGGGFGEALADPVLIGVVLGLVIGKSVGVFGGTYLVARFTRAELDRDLAWSDVFGLAALSGLGFTVSLLIGELAFGAGTSQDEHVKIGVLLGSLLAAVLAAAVLRRRNAHYRAVELRDTADYDGDGIPDVYEQR